MFVLSAFGSSCSTGPDYERDNEYDAGSNNFRSGTANSFSISVTEDAFYQLSWSDVNNNDGFIVGRSVFSKDTTIYERIATLGAYEQSFVDSSGISEKRYAYSVTSFTINDGEQRMGRDSIIAYARTSIGEIDSFEYMEADATSDESKPWLKISTKAVHESSTQDEKSYNFQLLNDVVVEYETEETDSYVVLDTLPVPIKSNVHTFSIPDTLKNGLKKYRVTSLLHTDNIQLEKRHPKTIQRVVDNPYNLSVRRLDEIIVEYTVTVADNMEQEEAIFDGVMIYVNDVVVDTLTGDFPQTATLSTKEYTKFVEVSIRAYIYDYVTGKRGERIDIDHVRSPDISSIEGDLSSEHTLTWTHQQYYWNPDVHSFIVERRTGEDEQFEEVAVTDPDVLEYKSSGLADSFYEYRVRTQISDPSEVVSTSFTNTFSVTNIREHNVWSEYVAISNSMRYRLVEGDNYVFDVYQNQNQIDEINLHNADFSDELNDYAIADVSFSEDEKFVVFLLMRKFGDKASIIVYDSELNDFVYVKEDLKTTDIVLSNSMKVVCSGQLNKILYLNTEFADRMGAVDMSSDTNTLHFVPRKIRGDGNGIFPLGDKFILYLGNGDVYQLYHDLSFTKVEYQAHKISRHDAELYGYDDQNLFVVDLHNLAYHSTPVQERISGLLYFDRSSNTIFHNGSSESGEESGGLFAYDVALKRSVNISDITLNPDSHFKKTDDGIVVITEQNKEYLIVQSDNKKWQDAERPVTN